MVNYIESDWSSMDHFAVGERLRLPIIGCQRD